MLLHILPLVPGLLPSPRPVPPPPPMVASLRPPPVAPLPPPPPDATRAAETCPGQAAAGKRPLPEKSAKAPKTWTQAIAQHLKKLNDAGQFYPPEAIARGLEGEVLVLIVIDESGHVSGARVEQGSGHRILDDAALRAVRSLRSLPADAPREALLPVRFRLR
ncbi:MAG: TonB family protein [Dechloromonas sp.]|nr:MAG: TonB family protein [Dechloromonas sp.]